MAHSIFSWLGQNVGKTFKSPRPGAKDIQILVVDDESGRLNIKFVGGVQALPLYFWMFERVINNLISQKNSAVRLGAKLAPPYDPNTIEGQIWRVPYPQPPRTPFKASPHVCDFLVIAGVGEYEKRKNPATGKNVWVIKYRDGESNPKSPKEVFVSAHRDKIIRWADKMKDLIVSSRLAYHWRNKSTLECVTERNKISKAIVLSRIRCKGGIDLDTLDKVTKWGFNKEFPLRDAAKVLKVTQEAFSFLDAGDLIQATKTLLDIPGVGISRASKVLGLFDQDNLCIYDSRVGQALKDLKHENNRLVMCPPGRNRLGDNLPPDDWAKQYQRLIWTLEIIRNYINTKGNIFRLADVEMALFIMGK
jgi:hypothetical protein